METNELDFHAWWTVNEEHLLKPYQELFGLSLDLERRKRQREERLAGSILKPIRVTASKENYQLIDIQV